jgi:hypothetical protein
MKKPSLYTKRKGETVLLTRFPGRPAGGHPAIENNKNDRMKIYMVGACLRVAVSAKAGKNENNVLE